MKNMETREAEENKAEKKRLRREALARRNELTEEARKRADLLLTERILGHQWFYQAEKLLIFVSFGSEIDTLEIILEALRKQKKVYVPKVCGRGEMEFYRIFAMEELKAGYQGIPEPDGSSEKYLWNAEEKGVLMIMPGAAFDPYRNRIGYGGGFYDRYLADKEPLQLCTIGVGYGCQQVEKIPAEDTDIRPYQVILA